MRSLHVSLKLFRPQHGHEQVDQQPNRDDPNDDVFHDLQLSTRIGVKNRDCEKGDGYADKNQI